MRKSLGAALALGFVTIATTALAQTATVQDARVTLVDRAGKGFSAQWYTGNASYQTNSRTTFRAGGTPTSFDYIKAGMNVRVTSHLEGQTPVVDDVVFVQ
jgi:hypothetical protein